MNYKIVNIKDNFFENIPKRKQKSLLNQYLKDNVKGKDYYVDGEKIIANSVTIGKLGYGNTNFSKNIEIEIRKELKANIIVNLNEIIKESKLYQKNRIDTKEHKFADFFDRRKTVIIYKNHIYEVMFELGKKGNVNTLYSIENVKKIGKLPREYLKRDFQVNPIMETGLLSLKLV